MITITDKKDCSGCYACASVCPVECIRMEEDAEGFEYPRVDTSRCTGCGLCERICHLALSRPDAAETYAIAAKADSDGLRMSSSSGGVFSVLAQWVLEQGGAVYGVAMGEDALVSHIRITDPDELYRLRGSKYVQSRVGYIHFQVRTDLRNGLTVLFSGTPCQIGGLRNYLGMMDAPSLICHDLICHGVPPQKIWKKHLREIGFNGTVESSFRDKTAGWKDFYMRIEQGNRRYLRPFGKDAYGAAFLGNIMLRPSCNHCRYRGMQYRSDITLADFWGVWDVIPDFYDEKGVSLILIHTQKGRDVMEKISKRLLLREVDLEPAIKRNRNPIYGFEQHPDRERFFSEIDSRSLKYLVAKYITGSLARRASNRLKRILRRK